VDDSGRAPDIDVACRDRTASSVIGYDGCVPRRRHRDLARAVTLLCDFSVSATQAAKRSADATLVHNSPLAVLTRLTVTGPLQPRDLLDFVPVTAGGMSNLLGRLERDGLVTRRSGDTSDQRAVVVEVTDRGRDIVARVSNVIFASMATNEALVKETIVALVESGAAPGPIELPETPSSAIRLAMGLSAVGVALQRAIDARSQGRPSSDINAELVLIVLLDQGPCRPRRLVELMGITSAGISRLVDRSERNGFVQRSTEGVETDGRSVAVSLTPAGLLHVESVLDRIAPHFDEFLGLLRLFMNELHSDDWR
jgi:DNA-binding MarR family transcriptional regulator